MANPIQRRLLQLAFLAIFCSHISVCGDRGQYADEDDAQPLVPSNGKGGKGTPQDENKRGGSFGWWKKWTECAYNVNNQCMEGPGGDQKVIRSYRILAYCAGGDHCEGAKLLFCYPSRLDPRAFPDEKGKEEDITPGRRAMSQITVTNDPDNNITKACAMLLDECRKDTACLGTLPEMAQKDGEGEQWHGFLIAREKNGFDIHMPFGKDGKRFHIMDLNGAESPHIYLNFGSKDRPWTTFVSDDNLRLKFTTHNAKDKYILGSRQGIHLNEAEDLWMLGLDILPDEEHQVLRLYTAGFPVVHKWNYCDRNQQQENDGLIIVQRNETAYIDSWFLKPYTPDMAVPRRPIPEKMKTIELVNNNYTQPINTSQGFTRFFVHAQVDDGTKSMGIKIVIGSLEDFKLTLFQFEYNKENGICFVFFHNMPKNCKNFKFDGIRKSFWIFVDMDKGKVALNCQREYQFDGPLIFPIVDEAKFEITGEGFKLFELTQDHKAVLKFKSTEYVNQPIFMKLPFQLDKLNILTSNIIYFELTSQMFNASKFIHFELIGNNSNTNKNELLIELVFITTCPSEGIKPESIVGTSSKENMVACISLICHATCAGEFNFVLQSRPLKLYLNGMEAKYQYVDRKKIPALANPTQQAGDKPTKPAGPNNQSYSGYNAQLNGDLIKPVQLTVYKKVIKTTLDKFGNANKLSELRYTIIHGMVFNKNGTITIKYKCKNFCTLNTRDETPVARIKISDVLILRFDLGSGIVETSVTKENGKVESQKSEAGTVDLKMAKPFWIKIAVLEVSKHFYYRTFLNDRDNAISDIYPRLISNADQTYTDEIDFNDNNAGRTAVLVDDIVVLPMAHKILKNTAADGFEITTTFRILESCKIVQMFLGSISTNTEIETVLGIDDMAKMNRRIYLKGVKVYAHFLAKFDIKSDMFKCCFGLEVLFKSGNQMSCDGDGMTEFVYDPNEKGKIVKVEIAVAKDGTIQIDFNGQKVTELKTNVPVNNAAQSTHFVTTEYVNKPIKLPIELDKLNILDSDTIYLLFTSKMFEVSKSKFIYFKLIGNNSNTNKNELLVEIVFMTKCPEGKKPESIVETPSKEKMVACVSLECGETCVGDFNFLMQFDQHEKMKLYLNGKEIKYQFVNRDQIEQILTLENLNEHTYATRKLAALFSKTSYKAFYAQIFGDLLIQPVHLDVYKNVKKTTFDELDIFGNFVRMSLHRYTVIHGMVFNKKRTFTIQYKCKYRCILNPGEEPPEIKIANVLTLKFSLDSGIVHTFVTDENGKTLENELQRKVDLNGGKPFWIKIAIAEVSSSSSSYISYYYKTFLNSGDNIFSEIHPAVPIARDIEETYADEILVISDDGNVELVDNIVVLPMALEIVKAKPNVAAADGFTITTTFRILNNSQIIQMYLASISGNMEIDTVLGIDSIKKMYNQIEWGGVYVSAHFLANFDQYFDVYKFCFGQELLLLWNGTQKNCDGAGMAQFNYDHNKESRIVNAEIAVAKDGTIQIDFNKHRVAELKPKNATKNAALSTHFVISGEITLIAEPKQ